MSALGFSIDGISIHAPARGATLLWWLAECFYGNFNPRSREGSDLGFGKAQIGLILISIHAPARGATTTQCYKWLKKMISIHAPARGATLRDPHKRYFLTLFQSTLPRGERQSELTRKSRTCYDFNPRSREGSDGILVPYIPCGGKFQSTLPRGERLADRKIRRG